MKPSLIIKYLERVMIDISILPADSDIDIHLCLSKNAKSCSLYDVSDKKCHTKVWRPINVRN